MNVKLKHFNFFFNSNCRFYFSSGIDGTSYISKKVLFHRSFQQSRRYGRWISWRTFACNLLIERVSIKRKMSNSLSLNKRGVVLAKLTVSTNQEVRFGLGGELLVLYLQHVLFIRQLSLLILLHKLSSKFF